MKDHAGNSIHLVVKDKHHLQNPYTFLAQMAALHALFNKRLENIHSAVSSLQIYLDLKYQQPYFHDNIHYQGSGLAGMQYGNILPRMSLNSSYLVLIMSMDHMDEAGCNIFPHNKYVMAII